MGGLAKIDRRMGLRGPQPKPFDATWTPTLAWVVGIIATDGCLSLDGRHIDITSKDFQLLETAQRCLKIQIRIGEKRGGFSSSRPTYAHRIQITRSEFHQWLVTIGFTPRKSKTIAEIDVPDRYFWDFLRGCFDGDGSCYAYRDPRWPMSYLFYWELCSASPMFIRWIRQRVRELVGLHGHISADGNTEILKYAKHEAVVLFDRMYSDRRAPCLLRKRDKVDHIMRTWRNWYTHHLEGVTLARA